MATDVIEGEVREVEEPHRAIVPVQPGQAIVTANTETGPTEMLARATAIATALSAMIERQRLFTFINDKKYPHVEAWLTIGRMDNVVAREASPPIRREDGSYEAFVELVRLSDGMVIGGASALCGTPDDKAGRNDWSKRAEPQKRSMAVTRATSRAFRLQYSWIMALAGYEPTPREEMDGGEERPSGDEGAAATQTTHRDGLIGKLITQGIQDFELHQTPSGFALPFRVKEGRLSQIAVAEGDLALSLYDVKEQVLDKRATVWGHYSNESFDRKDETIRYKVLHVERIATAAGTFPIPEQPVNPRRDPEDELLAAIPVAEGQQGFDMVESARIDAEAAATS